MSGIKTVGEQAVEVSTTVNGEALTLTVSPRLNVADLLRSRLGLTGTHVGCEQGVCGMCTVIVDGEAVKSCLMLACQLDGRSICTVESLAQDDQLNPLQTIFAEEHALQCGFCTPAFLMTATALAYQGGQPSREEIREEVTGVLCRCTGYQSVVTAIHRWFVEHPPRTETEDASGVVTCAAETAEPGGE